MSPLSTVTLAVMIGTLTTLLHVGATIVAGNGPSLDVTNLFSLEINSTCGGETPTLFESRSGELSNCSLDEHNSSYAVDGDPNTWWQSQNGDTPLALTFTLSEVRCKISGRACI